MAKQQKEYYEVIVTPATDNAHKEGFVKINGQIIPFGIKRKLHLNDIKAIQRLKEPKKSTRGANVHDLMDKLKLPQEKVNQLLKENADMRENNGITFIRKYNVVVL